MHILITGGTGFIGQAFINTHHEDYNFTVLTRNVSNAKKTFSHISTSNIKFISQLEELPSAIHIDAVINLAGSPIMDKMWSDKHKHILESSRWEITQQLADFIATKTITPEVFISGSAIGVYGRQGSETIDETHGRHYPEYSSHLCEHWEEIARTACPNTRTAILRTGIVLGKNNGALQKMELPFRLGLGGPIGKGDQYMSWIHIDDMVAAIHYLIQHKTCSGTFNLTSPNPVTNREFSDKLAASFNNKARITTPKLLLRLLLGERADIIIYGQRVLPTRLLDSGFVFHFETLERALSAIYTDE
ncbi:TIGR01777 family oxidoreductase [Moritella sp. Urea-trap-13]|uniref:TIGR01777 family oxidoreductase n=1 Tax=Moritella sp. Urea-trap-13 TaxID=2058327 RepID=UPI000C332795|nr:TIGR01777 family oxidoreductase [Moritella sp. Urea-trap-13]PKH06247.1 TIGR01777 family protein [Moritella sp. Urea-trap-13]